MEILRSRGIAEEVVAAPGAASTAEGPDEGPRHLGLTTLVVLGLSTAVLCSADVTRYPLPNNSTFPIAMAVEVTGGTTLVHHSGVVPAPADPKAEKYSAAYWGDTETQATSVFERIGASIRGMGLDFGNVIKMTVFLAGDPGMGGKMDFGGFMKAYTKYFGTEEQPNLPARSAVQVAGLAGPGMLVEIEVILARPESEK